MNKIFLILFFTLLTQSGIAQKSMVKNGKANTDSFQFNKRDHLGRPSGLWYRFNPERMGEPGYFDFGYYKEGIRNGAWYKISENGELMSIEHYKNNVLNGEARYFDNGKLAAIGNYRGYNPDVKLDTILVVDPVTHYESLKVVHNNQGSTKHGTWKYYNTANGRVVREEEWQVDELIDKKIYTSFSDSTLKEQKAQSFPHALRPDLHHQSGRRLIEGQ